MFEDESLTFQLKKAVLRLWQARQESWPGLILLLVGLILVILSLLHLVGSAQADVTPPSLPAPSPGASQPEGVSGQGQIFVDVSGAVIQPGLYQVDAGDRVATALARAGGLNHQADLVYVSKTLNLAKKLSDSDKIYIPFINEARPDASTEVTPQAKSPQAEQVSLNQASADELDALPGIGASRAESIIANRPYQQLDELVTKKVLSQSLFDQIATQLTL